MAPLRHPSAHAVDPLDWGPRGSLNASYKPKVSATTANMSIRSALRVHGDGSRRAVAGMPTTFLIELDRRHKRPQATTGGGIFFVRLIGPSLLVARVHQLQDDIWQVNYTAHDPGLYVLQVVLEYSHNRWVGGATDWGDWKN